MHNDLWEFALKVYARPGVQQACLRLQAGGGNVCLLLCGAWLGSRGVAPSAARVAQLQQVAGPWHAAVIEPLRSVRQGWREQAREDARLDGLREQVKALELRAEKVLLEDLRDVAQAWAGDGGLDVQGWLQALGPTKQDRDALQALRDAALDA